MRQALPKWFIYTCGAAAAATASVWLSFIAVFFLLTCADIILMIHDPNDTLPSVLILLGALPQIRIHEFVWTFMFGAILNHLLSCENRSIDCDQAVLISIANCQSYTRIGGILNWRHQNVSVSAIQFQLVSYYARLPATTNSFSLFRRFKNLNNLNWWTLNRHKHT